MEEDVCASYTIMIITIMIITRIIIHIHDHDKHHDEGWEMAEDVCTWGGEALPCSVLGQVPSTPSYHKNLCGHRHHHNIHCHHHHHNNLHGHHHHHPLQTKSLPWALCVCFSMICIFMFLYHLAKGSHPAPIVQFLFNCSHSIFLCKFCIILNAFWQHKIDIKRLLRVEMSQIKGIFKY